MQELDNFRLVQIDVECADAESPISWTQHTTRTHEEMRNYGAMVGRTVCENKAIGHQRRHVVTVTDLADDGQVSRHA